MRAVIIGGGAVGFQIAQQLTEEGNHVVLLEKDTDQANHLANRLDCMVVNKEGNNLEVLKEAGTAQADVFIAVTSSDEVNMISCGLVAREFAVPVKIARVRNANYSTILTHDQPFIGIDYIVNPEIEAAREILNSVRYGALSDIIVFERSNLMIRTYLVQRDSQLAGMTLRDASQHLGLQFLVAVIVRGNRTIIPSGNTDLIEGDILYFAGMEEDLERLFAKLGKPRTELRKILLVGGGRIGTLIASELAVERKRPVGFLSRLFRRIRPEQKSNLIIVEKDYEQCRELSGRFPGAVVVNADISDEEVFQEEQLGNTDMVVAVTDNQELNIVTALYAKSLGIPRSVVLVLNNNYLGISTQLGIDVTVSLKKAIANTILSIVRKGYIRSIHTATEVKIEILEFAVIETSAAVDKQIRDLGFPPDSLIISISRDGETFIPDGSTVIKGADHLIVIAKQVHYEKLRVLFTEPA